MKKCVESGPVTTIQRNWCDNILKLIPGNLREKRHLDVINDIFDEVKVNYESSMKKAMGTYVQEYECSVKKSMGTYVQEYECSDASCPEYL